MGTFELLEAARAHPPQHMLLASTSSAYGANTEMPYAETHKADSQMSFYAATKKANEVMAHSYAHLYHLPTTMFRFFTVYGPWGRPDMAYFGFTKKILSGESIDVYNHGKMQRDFTYIDDIVEGVTRITEKIPAGAGADWTPESGDSSRSSAPYKIYNIGNHNTVQLGEFIQTIEDVLGVEADKNYMEMQAGDVVRTYANVDDLIEDVEFAPNTPLKDGIQKFAVWYRDYYGAQ